MRTIIQRPEIDVDAPDAIEEIYQALVANNADIVIDDDGALIWTHDAHFWDLEAHAALTHCLPRYMRFSRNDKYVDVPKRLGKEFVEWAMSEGKFNQEYRGPCPRCHAAKR